jgi:hypothetical protein
MDAGVASKEAVAGAGGPLRSAARKRGKGLVRADRPSRKRPHFGGSGPADNATVVVLLPLFNDWESLRLVLADLDASLARSGTTAAVVVVDDGSATAPGADFPGGPFEAIGRVEVVELRRNLGHQRAIAVGLAYVEANIPCRAVVVMDSDGEDAPADVPRLLARLDEEGGRAIVFAERARRSESLPFVLCYHLFKILHWILTGSRVRVGNFSAIPRARLASLVAVSEVWNHYAAAVFVSRQPSCAIPTTRAVRRSGRSRMDFVRLVAHGLSAISVHGEIVGVRLLVATLGLMALALAGLVATVTIRLATDWAIPGWATSAIGSLVLVLLQAAMFCVVFSFLILGGRQGSSFLPARDYAHYVGAVRVLREAPAR